MPSPAMCRTTCNAGVDFNVPQDKKDPSIITNTARCAARSSVACAGIP